MFCTLKDRRSIHIKVCKLLFAMCREPDLNLRPLSKLAGISKSVIISVKDLKPPVRIINSNICASGLAVSVHFVFLTYHTHKFQHHHQKQEEQHPHFPSIL